MSNKTQLQNNNATLDGYIARINAAKDVAAGLPEAGGSGGGSVETFTLTYEWVGPGDFMVANRTIYYTDKNLETKPVTPTTGTTCTVEVLKNSIVVITGGTSYIVNGCQELGGGYGVYAYIITANNAIMEGD